MPIQISCPSCRRQLRVPDNLVGQMVKCPSCQNTFVAAVEEPPEPLEPTPTEERFREESRAARERRPARNEDDEAAVPRRPPRDDDDFEERPLRRRGDFVPHRGTLILVLGILSLSGMSLLTGIPAWIMGNNDLQQIRAGVMDPEGESNTNIGRILGMVGTLLALVGLLPVVFCCCMGGLGGIFGK